MGALALLLTALYFLAPGEASIHLSTGLKLTKQNKIFYESSVILSYNTELPKYHEFLQNYTCDFEPDICSLHNHVKTIVGHSLTMLDHSLPHLDQLELQKYRSKKGIAWFSSPFHWCCSFAQDSQVNDLAMKHENLEKLTEKLKFELLEQHSSAVSNNKLLHTYSEEIKNVIGAQIAKNELQLRNITEQMNDSIKRNEVITDTTSMLVKLSYRLALALNWLKITQQCKSKHTPTILLENQQLKTDLEKIEKSLTQHDYRLTVLPHDIHTYLGLQITKCYYSDKELLITINVPIISKHHNYEFHSVKPLPFLYSGQICSVSLDEKYIVIKNGKEIMPLNIDTAQTCLTSALCHVSPYPTHFHHDSHCIEKAMVGSSTVSQLRSACAIKCSNFDNSKPIILKISENEIGIIAPNTSIKVKCPGKNDREISTKEQIGIMVVELPCLCTAYVETEKIHMPYPCQKGKFAEAAVKHHIAAIFAGENDDQLLIHPHTTIRNISTFVNTDWQKRIPILDLSNPPTPSYEPSFHEKHGHFFSFGTIVAIIGIIITIVVITFKGKAILDVIKGLIDPATLVEKILALLFTRPALTSAKPANDEYFCYDSITHNILEAMTIVLLLGIFILLLIILIKLIKSKLLSLFNEEFIDYNVGKVKISMINTNDKRIPARIIQHHFTKECNDESGMTKQNAVQATHNVSQNDIINALKAQVPITQLS